MKGQVKKMTCPCPILSPEAFRIHGPSKKYKAGEWEGIKANDDDPFTIVFITRIPPIPYYVMFKNLLRRPMQKAKDQNTSQGVEI